MFTESWLIQLLFLRSYGIYLAQNLARLVIKRGYKPFVVIRHENEASKSLYRKLGFEKVFEMARIVFTPAVLRKEDGDYEDEGSDACETHENGNQNGKTGQNGVNSHGQA